jgi:hypothetical protein
MQLYPCVELWLLSRKSFPTPFFKRNRVNEIPRKCVWKLQMSGIQVTQTEHRLSGISPHQVRL